MSGVAVIAVLLFLTASIAGAESHASPRWEYSAANKVEPDASGIGFHSSGAGEASFTSNALLTSDTGPNDGRYYYWPEANTVDIRGGRLEITARVIQSSGHLCATAIYVPIGGKRAVSPLNLGSHGEGYQSFIGSSEAKCIVLGFSTNETDHSKDQLMLIDPTGQGRMLSGINMPVNVLRKYTLSFTKNAAGEDIVNVSVDNKPQPSLTVKVSDLQPISSRFGLMFGHPTGAGVGEAEWSRLALYVSGTKTEYVRKIGNHKQLFVDDWIVGDTKNLQRSLGKWTKHPNNPVVKRDKPWENSRCELYGSCVWDPVKKRLQLYYTAMDEPYNGKLAYAESYDGGSTWIKPELDIYLYKGQKSNIIFPGRYYVSGPSVIRDEHDPDPSRRYKLFTCAFAYMVPLDNGPQGMDVAYSPDGIHFTPSKDNPVIKEYNSDTGQSLIWDQKTNSYAGYIRIRSDIWRSIGITRSKDFEHWTEPRLIYVPTAQDVALNRHFYGLAVTPYEGQYIGLVWIFPDTEDSKNPNVVTPVTWMELTSSRDGENWQESDFGKQFIPLGPKGSFDHRQIRPASSLVVMDDKIVFLYAGSPNPHISSHKWDIGLATLRKDGFVSMDAGDREGTLLTQPINFKSGKLHINAAVSNGGYVKAELLDNDGKVIDGYSAKECKAFKRDSIDAVLAWNKKNTLPATDSKGLKLRFLLKNAKLYSFAVKSVQK
jgi:hypothetical protein